MNIIDVLKYIMKPLAGIFGPVAKRIATEIRSTAAKIPIRYLIGDAISVIRSVFFLLVFNILAFVIFVCFSPGKDIILVMVEEVGVQHRGGNLVFLLLGTTFWSVVSEFACRYSIYVTDNSAKSISEDRVEWRKTVQNILAKLFLLLPFIIIFISLIINYFSSTGFTSFQKNFGFGLIAVLLYTVFYSVSILYLDDKWKNKMKKNSVYGYKYFFLTKMEDEWVEKLYGIYNDFTFAIRKPDNFSNEINGDLKTFCDNFLDSAQRDEFPQSELVSTESRVPAKFTLKPNGFAHEDGKVDGQYRWTYKIPKNFYKHLHIQVYLIVGLCVIIMALVCTSSTGYYENIGAPGLLCGAFAAWIGIYVGIIYVDYALHFGALRFILIVWLIICSIANNDHPIRYNDTNKQICDTRPYLKEHFKNWLTNYQRDSSNLYFEKDSSAFYPVLFVCAEGGALRTGGFTGITLSFLQDSLAKYGFDFKKSIYCMSGVSGGSLGISFFNAMAYLSDSLQLKTYGSYDSLAKTFFNQDYLAALIGKMFYGDVLNLFLPYDVYSFDRAIALEESWENGYNSILKTNGENIFSDDFIGSYCGKKNYPAVFYNTTEVETGQQCWLTNVRPDSSILLFKDRDLISRKIKKGINYSTAVNFSSRFPAFSPSAAVQADFGKKYHYVDGGYVENTGSGTALEILESLHSFLDSSQYHIKPYVLLLRFSDDSNAPFSNINFGNSWRDIITGIYNTRESRTDNADSLIRRFVKKYNKHDGVIEVALDQSGTQVPMNWILSEQSLNNISADITAKWLNSRKNELKSLFYFDTSVKSSGNDKLKRVMDSMHLSYSGR